MSCQHIQASTEVEPQNSAGCQDCLAIGFTGWVHLRLCLTCGKVGCCDSSPHQHATAHFKEVGHPVVRSFEPGEFWRWCYADETIG
jgi:uncharacterized UBP type Zn finger protein